MARKNKSKKKGKGSSGFNRKNSDDFLGKNAKKQDVHTTPSGLQYLIVDQPEQTDNSHPDNLATVETHQRITLVDGTIVQDTYKKNETAIFKMAEAIEGYGEGLSMMVRGARYKFFIPSELAWGKRGAGSKIGPNAVLIVDCRLVDFW